MTTKTYEVKLTAICVVVVEADSEEEALSRATEETNIDEYEFVEGGPAKLVDPKHLDGAIRHCNVYLEATS